MNVVCLKKTKMFFLLNFFTFAIMNRLWRLSLEFSMLLITRFLVNFLNDANVVDNCARVFEYRRRIRSLAITLLKFCVCDFCSLSHFDFCFFRASFVNVVSSSLCFSIFWLMNSFISSLFEHIEDASSFVLATIFCFSIVKISSQINDKVCVNDFSLCSFSSFLCSNLAFSL